MSVMERIKGIRIAEGMSQQDFCRETGINLDTLRKYEQGKTKGANTVEIEKITNHQRFKKYALWLVTGETAPEVGQISPEHEEVRAQTDR